MAITYLFLVKSIPVQEMNLARMRASSESFWLAQLFRDQEKQQSCALIKLVLYPGIVRRVGLVDEHACNAVRCGADFPPCI